MTDADRTMGKHDLIDRRTILKGAAAGLLAVPGAASADGEHEITFVAPADEDAFRYEFSVTGEVSRGDNTDGGDVISGNTVTGAVGEGRKDTFYFTGDLQTLAVNGAGKVLVDGQVIQETSVDQSQTVIQETTEDAGGGEETTTEKQTAQETTTETAGAEGALPKLLIVSSSTDEYLDYTFEVTGDIENLEPDEDGPPAIDDITQVDGRARVEGTVGYGDDQYAFSGELIEIDVPPEVSLDTSTR